MQDALDYGHPLHKQFFEGVVGGNERLSRVGLEFSAWETPSSTELTIHDLTSAHFRVSSWRLTVEK